MLALFWHTEWRKAGCRGGMDELGESVHSQSAASTGLLLSLCISRVAQLRSLGGCSPNKLPVGAGKERGYSCISEGGQEPQPASRWCMG